MDDPAQPIATVTAEPLTDSEIYAIQLQYGDLLGHPQVTAVCKELMRLRGALSVIAKGTDAAKIATDALAGDWP